MYRYGKFKYTLAFLKLCWEVGDTTMYVSSKFELLPRLSQLPELEFVDEIELIDKSIWEYITKNLKGKLHGRDLARNE